MRSRSHYHRSASAQLVFNATPMVDVIFMLTVFFMLVSSFSEEENVPLELPRPTESQAKTALISDRVVINCLPADPLDPIGGGVLYRLGPNRPVPLEVLSQNLAAFKRDVPELKVVLRADRRLAYADVRAVMREIARNNIEMLNVGAETRTGTTTP